MECVCVANQLAANYNRTTCAKLLACYELKEQHQCRVPAHNSLEIAPDRARHAPQNAFFKRPGQKYLEEIIRKRRFGEGPGEKMGHAYTQQFS